MREIKPRIIVVIEGGLVASVHCEGITEAERLHVVVIDYDTDCDDPDDLTEIAGDDARVCFDGADPLNADVARDVEAAYQQWLAQ